MGDARIAQMARHVEKLLYGGGAGNLERTRVLWAAVLERPAIRRLFNLDGPSEAKMVAAARASMAHAKQVCCRPLCAAFCATPRVLAALATALALAPSPFALALAFANLANLDLAALALMCTPLPPLDTPPLPLAWLATTRPCLT